jgi:very-short-patch-repair endonuclease
VDDLARQRALRRRGVVAASELGAQPHRAARAAGLYVVQPRAFLARTQPLDGLTLALAVAQSVRGRSAFLGAVALWAHGAGPQPRPDEVLLGVPHATRLVLHPPARVSRVSEHVLARTRVRRGLPVVDLELALLQVAAGRPVEAVARMLEPVLRERRTTPVRLRERCRRGLSGSAVVRRAVDELVGGSLDRAVRALQAALAERGVEGLQTEVRFVSAAGASCYGDLWCPRTRTLVEVDGFLTHAVRERFRADRRRDRWMAGEHDVRTLRVDAAEVWHALDELADELAALLLPRPTASAG